MTDAIRYERRREREVGLGPRAERAARAVIEAVFAPAEGEVPPERVTWVCREIDDYLARVTTRSYAIVLLSLFVVSVAAPLLVRRLGPLASLAPKDRVIALEHLERSALSPALLAVKALLCVHYYEHPDAAREIGFDGAP